MSKTKAPESYLNCKRPPLFEAIELEGEVTVDRAMESLAKKGYFSPRPRPWKLGFHDRGLGRGDFGILDQFGDLVAEVTSEEDGRLIVSSVNTDIKGILEEEAAQLEKWAHETRTPMGITTILGDEMLKRAKYLRAILTSLESTAAK